MIEAESECVGEGKCVSDSDISSEDDGDELADFNALGVALDFETELDKLFEHIAVREWRIVPLGEDFADGDWLEVRNGGDIVALEVRLFEDEVDSFLLCDCDGRIVCDFDVVRASESDALDDREPVNDGDNDEVRDAESEFVLLRTAVVVLVIVDDERSADLLELSDLAAVVERDFDCVKVAEVLENLLKL